MKIRNLILGGFAAFGLMAGAASAASVTLTPDDASLEIGQTFNVVLATSGDFPEVFGVEGDLSFDDSLLEFNSITYQTFDIFADSELDASGDLFVSAGFVDPFTTISGSFSVADIEFTTLASGQAVIDFLGFGLIGSNVLAFEGGASTTVSIRPVDPSIIPLPAGSLLLLSGLAGLAVARRRKAQS